MFANIYSDLYSKVELSDKFESFCESINSEVKQDQINEVNKVNEKLVNMAMNKMKGSKSDVLFDFTSDLLIHGPP